MSEERKKPGVGFWSAVAFSCIILYVLSSGPARSVLMWDEPFPDGTVVLPDGTTAIRRLATIRMGGKWTQIYAPLDRVSRERFGAPLLWYWQFFPIEYKR
jgi:hypothetical protein